MNKIRIIAFLLLFLSLITLILSLVPLQLYALSQGGSVANQEMPELDYSEITYAVDITEVRKHLEFFAGLGTRATGYPSNLRAAQYIYDKFVEYGLKNVTIHHFNTVDFIDYGANITIEGKMATLYPILPNLVSPSTTPPEGITGYLIYAGVGYMEDFQTGADAANTSVEGNIVLLDWNTRNRWINAARLGAKAVIFLPPPDDLPDPYMISGYGSFRYDWFEKYLPNVPFNFPRFYVNKTDAELLLSHLGEEARIVSTQRWRKLDGQNIIGFVEGKNTDVAVLISSYYDSYAITPSLAPGAQEACGISYLLELAKYFAKPENKPENTIIFAAFGGHGQFLAGSNAFIRDYRSLESKPELKPIGDMIWLHINLDFSTGSDILRQARWEAVGRVPDGTYGGINQLSAWFHVQDFLGAVFKRIVQENPELSGKFYPLNIRGRSYDTQESWDVYTQPWRSAGMEGDMGLPMDHSWTLMTNVLAWSFTTALDPRPFFGSPFDTIDKVNFNNLETLCKTASGIIISLVNVENIKKLNGMAESTHWELPNYRWYRMRGQVAYYDPKIGFYKPVPNALLCWMLSGEQPEATQYMQYRYYYRPITFADEYGRFSVLSWHGYTHSWISAWVINETTGNVVAAPDLGLHKYAPDYIRDWDRPSDIGFLTVFNCSSIVFFDVFQHGLMALQSPEHATGGLNIFAYQLPDYIEPVSRGVKFWNDYPTIAVVFVPPDNAIQITWKFSTDRHPVAALLNSNQTNSLGSGYTLAPGEQLIIPMSAFNYAKTLYHLNEERFRLLVKNSPEIKKYEEYREHQDMGRLIKNIKTALTNHDYPNAEALSFKAWFLSKKVYDYLRNSIEDASLTVPTISAFFVPFVYLAEKLLFRQKGFKRIIALLGLFIFVVLAFYLLHPAFSLVASPEMVIVGFAILVLCLPMSALIFNNYFNFLNDLRQKRLGEHEIAVKRIPQVGIAFSVGVENMRRSRLRSTLTIITIILMVSAIVNLTSLSALIVPTTAPVPRARANYQGLYIHRENWGEGYFEITDAALSLIKNIVGDNATIIPRAWRYETFFRDTVELQFDMGFKVTYNGNIVRCRVLWGLTPEEKDLEVGLFLKAGRWFEPGEKGVVILTENQAKTLGINDADLLKNPTVVFEGMPHKVIGIISTEVENLYTLDGELVTPLKFDTVIQPNPWFLHVPIDYCLILPYKEVIDLGGAAASISIKVNDPTHVDDLAKRMSFFFPWMLTFSSVDGQVAVRTQRLSVTVWGWERQVVLMVIVIASIFNVILGSVYERKKDIFTYSVVGLSPLHISFMFLAETIVYALIGGVVGFLFAILMGKFSAILLQEILVLNYSSIWVLISLGIAILSAVVASIYPIRVASKRVTPSLERVWKAPTKPKGDIWKVHLPFFVSDEKEAEDLIEFIREFMEAHASSDAPNFYIKSLRLGEGTEGEMRYKDLTAEARLFPYDAGVSQIFTLRLFETERDRWQSVIVLKRIEGAIDLWERLNHSFLDTIRKQFLLWKSIKRRKG